MRLVEVPLAVALCLLGSGCHHGGPSRSRPAPTLAFGARFVPSSSEGSDGGPETTRAPPLGQVAPLGALVSDPASADAILAGALSGGTASVGSSEKGERVSLEAGIEAEARTQAPGMSKMGGLMFARLKSEGHAQATLELRSGGCYTIVGSGGPGVLDFQVNVLTAPPMPPQILAQSSAKGATPVVGGDGRCLVNRYAVPLTVNVDLFLIHGQGTVAARAYEK